MVKGFGDFVAPSKACSDKDRQTEVALASSEYYAVDIPDATGIRMNTPSRAEISALLLDFIEDSGNGVAILNADDICIFHNAAFVKLFELSGTSTIGRSFDELMICVFDRHVNNKVHWRNADEWLDHVHTQFRSAAFRNFEIELSDGTWLMLTEQVKSTGELILHCTDLTCQKHLELELKEAQVALEKLAFTDELTGVANRRSFLARLNEEVARSRRYRHPLCLAMLDLDHFKKINDTHGHPNGDHVLKHFAAHLIKTLRSTDIIGRLGGEEFAVALPETPLVEAMKVLRRFSDSLSKERLDLVAPNFSYTFSGGVGFLHDGDALDSNWLMACSDKALYQAKAAGRNRLMSFEVNMESSR